MGEFELLPWDKELRYCNLRRGDLVLMKSGHYAIVTKIKPSFLDDEAGLILKTHKDAEGKYGRILGELWRITNYADQSLNDYLVEKGHATPYFGGKR